MKNIIIISDKEPCCFSYVGNNDGEDGYIFEGRVELPNDGTPDSTRYLCITVTTHNEAGCTNIELDVISPQKTKRICQAETSKIENVADLLYGAARISIPS